MELFQHVPAALVPAAFKEMAEDWPLWESNEADPPLVDGKVHFDYNGDYGSERVLVASGRATLTPDEGMGAAFNVGPGDAIYLHFGFACTWTIHEPLVQHYGYFSIEGTEIKQTELTCDVCGDDCFLASYLFDDEMDICPRCFMSDAKGAEEYVGAQYQEDGKDAVEPKSKKKKRADSDDEEGDYKPVRLQVSRAGCWLLLLARWLLLLACWLALLLLPTSAQSHCCQVKSKKAKKEKKPKKKTVESDSEEGDSAEEEKDAKPVGVVAVVAAVAEEKQEETEEKKEEEGEKKEEAQEKKE